MRLAVLKERRPNETRVAATPETVRKLIALGLTVVVETGAGAGASFPDADFAAAGADIAPDAHAALAGAGVVFAVQPPEDLAGIPRGALLVCISGALADRDSVPAYAQAGIDVAAMELLPRITRAQSMDILSSQANLAGYRAVIEGANAFERGFAMMMTAAGTVPPARVFVVGAGVAGLQAIATARRLGAIVSATDVRPAAKEEIKSLGASFVGVEDTETAGQTGAYAREMSTDFRRKQAELMATTVAKNDMVICTALVQGGRAPVLVTKAMVDAMKPGSVVVDIAADGGGNCEATRPGEAYTTDRGVKILGYRNWPGRISVAASTLYAKNLLTFVTSFWDKEAGAPKLPPEDAIVQGVMLTRGGAVVHASFATTPPASQPDKEAAVEAAPVASAPVSSAPFSSARVSSSPEPTAGGVHAEALTTDPADPVAGSADSLPPGDGVAPEAAHQVASLDQSASAEPTASGLYGDALSGQVHADGPVPANDTDGAGEPAPDTASVAPAYGDGMPDSGAEGAPPPHEHDIAAAAGTPPTATACRPPPTRRQSPPVWTTKPPRSRQSPPRQAAHPNRQAVARVRAAAASAPAATPTGRETTTRHQGRPEARRRMNPDLAHQAQRLADNAHDLAAKLQAGYAGVAPVAAASEPFILLLTIFLLACFVGYYVVWNVTPALHSPLMAVTNGISSVIIVGAMLATGLSHGFWPHLFGFLAVTLASVNIFGGFLVTQRMLSMFKSKK